MNLRVKLTCLLATLLFTAQCSSPSREAASRLDARPTDGQMEIYKVPFPSNYYQPSGGFDRYVPLVVSTKEGFSERYGYWIFCDNPAEEQKIVQALGLHYDRDSAVMPSSLDSASLYNPPAAPDARAALIKQLEFSSLDSDQVLYQLYKLSPDYQSPVVCPSSLAKLGAGYSLKILQTGKKFYAEYKTGLIKKKAFEIGCRELRDSLLQAGNSRITQVNIPDNEKPAQISDLNCVNGSTLGPETFVSVCTEARAGNAPDDLFTLNTLIVKLKLNTGNSCEDLKTSIETYFAKPDTNSTLDMPRSGLKSLKLFQYLPAINNVKTLNLNDNPKLGETDNANSAAIDSLASFVGLTQLNIKGTAIANLKPLRDLQFLDDVGVVADWPNILPEACELSSISLSLAKACENLQIPLSLRSDRSGPIVVDSVSDSIQTLSLVHPYADLLKDGAATLTVKGTSTCSAALEGSVLKLTTAPTASCFVDVESKAAKLKPGVTRFAYKPLAACGEHAAGTDWTVPVPNVGDVHYICRRQGDEVQTEIIGGSCLAIEKTFDMTVKACVLKKCSNGKEVGTDWTVTLSVGSYKEACTIGDGSPKVVFVSASCPDEDNFSEERHVCEKKLCPNNLPIGKDWPVDTKDGLGQYKEICSLVGKKAQPEFVPGSGSCTNSTDYTFNNSTKLCDIKVCENGAKLGDFRPVPAKGGPGQYTQSCSLVNGKPTLVDVPNSGSCNDSRYEFKWDPKSCEKKTCEGNHEVESEWEQSTQDGRGSYWLKCDLLDKPTITFKANSGNCKSKKFLFDESKKSCVPHLCLDPVGDLNATRSEISNHVKVSFQCLVVKDEPTWVEQSRDCDDGRYDYNAGANTCTLARCSNGISLNSNGWIRKAQCLGFASEYIEAEYICSSSGGSAKTGYERKCKQGICQQPMRMELTCPRI